MSANAATLKPSLAVFPQEVLEHIVFFAATDNFLGPPSGILAFLTLNHALHDILSFKNNPHLYARIFAHKYDLASVVRRMGADYLPATALAEELRRRSIVLRRFRNLMECRAGRPELLDTMLWTAYLMVLESDGKNERQLREYAQINEWLKEYWFHPVGASGALRIVSDADQWPDNTERMSIAIWLFWFMLKPEEYTDNNGLFRDATVILKVIALGAHRYPSCYPSWVDYIPRSYKQHPTTVRHFSSDLELVAPAPASPAILAYLTLVNKLSTPQDVSSYSKPVYPTVDVSRSIKQSSEHDCDWARIRSLADEKTLLGNVQSGAFVPGSLEGVWEGIFTYTEFTSYAALLSGAPPSVLQRSLVAQHRQTIKVYEWHLIEPERDDEDEYAAQSKRRAVIPLPPGNPNRAYVPDGLLVNELPEALELSVPGRCEPVIYQACNSTKKSKGGRVVDVFLTGEGHSAWGQFNLIGRVRPSDGYISLSKEYTDGDRGKWLYRAYMVGNTNGNLSGRWRDTLSPAHIQGYEGTWVASRRR